MNDDVKAVLSMPLRPETLEAAIMEALILHRWPQAEAIGIVSPQMWDAASAIAKRAVAEMEAWEYG